MTLPETDLQAVHDDDHIQHHVKVHGAINRLTGSALPGDHLAVDLVDQPGVNRVRRRAGNEYTTNQVAAVTHTTPGIVTLPVSSTTRLVIVDAAADITGWDVAGAESHGAMCRLRVIVKATADIACSVTFGGSQTINPPNSAMTTGSIYSFQWVSFGTGGTITLSTSGIEGYGASVTGGAGNSVVEITTLADSGAGSLREALSAGNRIIRPAPGLTGDIVLTSRLETVGADNVTIDGDGRLRVLGRWLRFQDCDNLLVTRVKFGPVDDGGQGDSISIESADGATRDLHYAVTYCEFEGPNSDAAMDVVWNKGNDMYGTVAHCLFYKHWKTFLIDSDSSDPANEGGTYYTSFYRNWWYDNLDRQPYSQNANTHIWNSVMERYGEAGGGGGAVKTRGDGDTLLEYSVGLPRDIGETVGYDGATVTNAHDAVSEPHFTLIATATHKNVGNILLTSADGQSTATEIDSDDAATVFNPPYTYTLDTTPDPEEIRVSAGLGTDPRPGATGGNNTGGNSITGRTLAAGGGGSAGNSADLYASDGAGGFGAWLGYAVTDGNGDWSYENLDDGDYFVRVIAGGGGTWAETSANTWDSNLIALTGNTAADQGALNRAT